MKQYDLIVIGFGKAGKTLAKDAAVQGKKVAMIEESPKMYGGTCINIACIPTKTLIHDALAQVPFEQAMKRKDEVVKALNGKNYHNLADEENIDVFDNKAVFKSDKVVDLLKDGTVVDTLTADYIIINTGAKPIVPDIEGLKESKFVYDSTGIMELTKLPNRLVIIGGGYIALEFASMFSSFGTKVTVLDKNERLMKKEDQDIVEEAMAIFKEKQVDIVLNADTTKITDNEQSAVVETTQGNFEADAILVAVGRQPNTDLQLENTGITLGKHGEIEVNETLETAVPGVYAVGDVKGGMQFTYISLDDYRIVKDQIFGDKKRTVNNRGAVPYTVFIDPPLSRVGMTFEEAQKEYDAVENSLAVKNIPRHKVNNDPRGLLKVVVDRKTHQILGATLLALESEEVINIIKLAMDQKVPFEVLRDNIYTHPTMTESLNDLFKIKL